MHSPRAFWSAYANRWIIERNQHVAGYNGTVIIQVRVSQNITPSLPPTEQLRQLRQCRKTFSPPEPSPRTRRNPEEISGV
ncbi:uncharacterized protein Dana_GF27702 [Drosophila ananassae]|uniref:Uncharacterized protein n=1 Tax=Drosophila ananassae TaxID=7217 RepID=A0A0P9ACQ8_DROAN|nr:uncharacterized protein Dana_GF27702 [Drosophila ananassae]